MGIGNLKFLDQSAFRPELPNDVLTVLSKLSDNGFEARIVGGCIRDLLLNKIPQDWDICTSAAPEQVIAALSEYPVYKTGIQHGTVTAVISSHPIEITTYRIDGEYNDCRHPESVTFTSNIEDDLSRRDFTINAMAYSPESGLIDPFGGISDLNSGCLRCVGEPEKRFNEDALRIMRALRFAACLGFKIDEKTACAINRLYPLLDNIAVERISAELKKLLVGKDATEILRDYSNVFVQIIPELKATIGFEQKTRYHVYTVWEHLIKAVEFSPEDLIVRLTMLLHDIEKPSCFTIDENGSGHFYGHAKAGVKTTAQILDRLRFEKKIRDEVLLLISLHDSDIYNDKTSIKKWLSKVGQETFKRLISVKRADNLAQNPEYSYQSELDKIEKTLDEVLSESPCLSRKDLAINGDDILALGVTEGVLVGQIIDKLFEEVLNQQLENKKETLLQRARFLIMNL